jgi:alpha-glucosidase (family GH31 glycosyl hydrolase)
MEDVLLMEAFGIPNGVYWIDRPWGPGRLGYDDFDIDPARLPNFPEMVRWLSERQTRLALWIAPFFQGRMEKEAIARGYTLAGQPAATQQLSAGGLHESGGDRLLARTASPSC